MKNNKIIVASVVGMLFSVCPSALALNSLERSFFGLTALETSHPELTGTGYSVGVIDTEFDLTHPALGWTSTETFSQWDNANYIDGLRIKNPRIYSAALNASHKGSQNIHGGSVYSYDLPVEKNNTVAASTTIHGTSVAGTAGASAPGSPGVVPQAKFVLAAYSTKTSVGLGLVPDGNPTRTVVFSRSFTGSSFVSTAVRENSGMVIVNSAGNSFVKASPTRTETHGRSPHSSSTRWLLEKGYDLIAGGFHHLDATPIDVGSYGPQRNQETILTDYSVFTINRNGNMAGTHTGTSFSAPFLSGGLTMIQQAYENAHTNGWLRADEFYRILRKSAQFADDKFTGLRLFAADFEAAVELAIAYPGNPGFEPNFSTDFSDTNGIDTEADSIFINPNRFRVCPKYGGNNPGFTAPEVIDGRLSFSRVPDQGSANVALRNNWGDLAVVDLSRPGKSLSISFDLDMDPGAGSGANELYIGIKEMVGSDQFMDESRMEDFEPIGRLAFRIKTEQGSDDVLLEALICSEVPNTNDLLWVRSNPSTVPVWDAPLASVAVTNLTQGAFPQITVEVSGTHLRFLRDGTEILNQAHSVPDFALSRATPYLHFSQASTDQGTWLDNFEVSTVSTANPVVELIPRRSRALEGLAGHSPVRFGVVTVNRTVNTNTSLTVNYAVTGSASNGVDYKLLSGAITIPAGAAEGDLLIQPLADALSESDESVVIQLETGTGYSVGAVSAATVTLEDISDADGDGIANANEDLDGNGFFVDDDVDQDMLANYLDTDDDGDGVLTVSEDLNGNANPLDDDTDGDGTPNAYDTDDDGDGTPSIAEDYDGDGNPANDDYDGDGTPDYLDSDPAADSASMSVSGTFDGEPASSYSMALISNGLWRVDVSITQTVPSQFRFDNGTIQRGDADQTDFLLPLTGTAGGGEPNIVINGTFTGIVRFTLNESTDVYELELRSDPAWFTLPFDETFESSSPVMAGNVGAVDGQHGWVGDTGAVVQADSAYEFLQAASVRDATLSHSFNDGEDDVWVMLAWKPQRVEDSEAGSTITNKTVEFWVNTDGFLTAFSNQSIVVTATAVDTSRWSRVLIHSDYTQKKWSLWLDGEEAIQNFEFYSDFLDGLSQIVFEAELSALQVDDIQIRTNAWVPQSGDSDGDGLSDEWERVYWQSPNVVSNSTADYDGDGLSNAKEEIAGTHPDDELSYFRISHSVTDLPAGDFVLHWSSVTGRVYSVESSSNLTDGAWLNVASNLPATPPANVYTMRVDNASTLFGRIGVREE